MEGIEEYFGALKTFDAIRRNALEIEIDAIDRQESHVPQAAVSLIG